MQYCLVKWCVNDEVQRILEEALLGYGKSCPGMPLEGLKVSCRNSQSYWSLSRFMICQCETGGQANRAISALVKFTVGMYIWRMLFT